MRSDFGSILFKPTCSNCGRVINCDVKYRSSIDYQGITPNVCPYCGCVFENIIIPNPTNGGIFHYDETIYKHYFDISKGVNNEKSR